MRLMCCRWGCEYEHCRDTVNLVWMSVSQGIELLHTGSVR